MKLNLICNEPRHLYGSIRLDLDLVGERQVNLVCMKHLEPVGFLITILLRSVMDSHYLIRTRDHVTVASTVKSVGVGLTGISYLD